MSKKTKRPYTFHAEPAQLEWLREESERTGVPISEMIRRGVDLYRKQTQLVDARVVWRGDLEEHT